MASRIRRFFDKKAFSMQKVSDELAIKHVMDSGSRWERIAIFAGKSDVEVIEDLSDSLFSSAIPWYEMKNNPFLSDKADAFVQLYRIYVNHKKLVALLPDDEELKLAFKRREARLAEVAKLIWAWSWDKGQSRNIVVSKPEIFTPYKRVPPRGRETDPNMPESEDESY